MSQFSFVGAWLTCLVGLSACSSVPDSLFTPSGFSGAASVSGATSVGISGIAGAGDTTAGLAGASTEEAGSAGAPDTYPGHAGSGAGGSGGPVTGFLGGAGETSGVAGQPSVDPAGGAGPISVEGACKGKVVEAPAMLADFELGVSGWMGYIGDHFGPLQSSAPGAAKSGHAATFSGGYAQTSGMYRELGCADVTQFDGVSFYAKGQGGEKVRFLAAIPATDPVSDGGDCDEGASVCWDHPGKAFLLSDQWQQYHFAWKDLAQYGWGTKADFAGIVKSLLWINDGPVNGFAFSIDQVKLYKGSPTP